MSNLYFNKTLNDIQKTLFNSPSRFPMFIDSEKLEVFIKMDKQKLLNKIKIWAEHSPTQNDDSVLLRFMIYHILEEECDDIIDLIQHLTHSGIFHRLVVDFINNSEINN